MSTLIYVLALLLKIVLVTVLWVIGPTLILAAILLPLYGLQWCNRELGKWLWRKYPPAGALPEPPGGPWEAQREPDEDTKLMQIWAAEYDYLAGRRKTRPLDSSVRSWYPGIERDHD